MPSRTASVALLLAVAAGCGPSTPPTPVIPGLTPRQVAGRLTGLGCAVTGTPGATQSFWSYRREEPDHEMKVDFGGPGGRGVSEIAAMVIRTADRPVSETAAVPLGVVASTPYEGSDPDAARRWLERHLGDGGKTTVGGVTFTLTAYGEDARLLQMRPAAR